MARSGRPPAPIVLEATPGEDTHWSTRGLGARHGVSRETVGRIWRAFGLQPAAIGEFKISPDPLLVEKIRDIVGLYLSPPLNAPRAPHHGHGRGDVVSWVPSPWTTPA